MTTVKRWIRAILYTVVGSTPYFAMTQICRWLFWDAVIEKAGTPAHPVATGIVLVVVAIGLIFLRDALKTAHDTGKTMFEWAGLVELTA